MESRKYMVAVSLALIAFSILSFYPEKTTGQVTAVGAITRLIVGLSFSLIGVVVLVEMVRRRKRAYQIQVTKESIEDTLEKNKDFNNNLLYELNQPPNQVAPDSVKIDMIDAVLKKYNLKPTEFILEYIEGALAATEKNQFWSNRPYLKAGEQLGLIEFVVQTYLYAHHKRRKYKGKYKK